MSRYGFDLADLAGDPIKGTDDAYEGDVPQEAKAKLGDIYILGNHRLMCGDSTSPTDVEKLMDGKKGSLLFTSPPYTVKRTYEGNKDLSIEHLIEFIPTYLPYTDYQCVNLGLQRKDYEIVQYWDAYIEKARECGYKLLAWNVWDKMMAGNVAHENAFFPIRYEWIFVFGTQFFEIHRTWKKKECSIVPNKRLGTIRKPAGTMKYHTQGDTTKRLHMVL